MSPAGVFVMSPVFSDEITDPTRPERRRNQRDVPAELADARMISADQWAKLCGVTKRQVFRWQDAGHLPAPDLSIGQVRRWKTESFRSWQNSQEPDRSG